MEELEVGIGAPEQAPAEGQGIGAPTEDECMIAARQLQKYIEEKPFPQGGDFFMEGLVRHGELDAKEMSETVRVWRAVKRVEMKAEDLKQYGFIVPEGMKRVYQLEITLVCDTVPDEVMEVNAGQSHNAVPPQGEDPDFEVDEGGLKV